MIYRKLKGKRGCTMLTEYEADRIIRLLRQRNSNTVLIISWNSTFGRLFSLAQARKTVVIR